jgi:hypothetical protein
VHSETRCLYPQLPAVLPTILFKTIQLQNEESNKAYVRMTINSLHAGLECACHCTFLPTLRHQTMATIHCLAYITNSVALEVHHCIHKSLHRSLS